MNIKNQWLFEVPYPTNSTQHDAHLSPRSNRYPLFEVPPYFEATADYSEGTGRKKAGKRVDLRSIDIGDFQRGGVEPIRKPRLKPPRIVRASQPSLDRSQIPINLQAVARQKAQQRAQELTKYWIVQLEKSNPSGTAVRSQARIKAGAEMIREAKKLQDVLLANAYKIVGQQFIDKGNADLHPSKN